MSSLPRFTVKLPSPNNTKVTLALAYKGIEHELEDIVGQGEEAVQRLIEVSGQPLTPVLEHQGVVLFDSCAILRFLDANFDGPRLYSPDRDTLKEIEGWEIYHLASLGRSLRPAFGVVFQRLPESEHQDALAQVNRDMVEASAKAEERLAAQAARGSDWLVGDTMTAADICVASMLNFAAFPEHLLDYSPLWKWFDAHVDLGPDRPHCRQLVERVFAHLPLPKEA